jgi:small subunit ribosomal protein S1
MKNFERPKSGKNKIALILEKYNYKVKDNDILAGQIIGVERTYTLLDLGLVKASFLHKNEIFINIPKNEIALLKRNRICEVIILNKNLNNNKAIVSICKLHYLRLWERFKQINLKNMHLYTQFENKIRGGSIVKFDDLNVFIPNYHLAKFYKRFKKNSRLNFLTIKVLELKTKVQGKENVTNIIFGSLKLSLFKKYNPMISIGLIKIGTIVKVKKYGIFINIFGLKSLLHVSEIAIKNTKNLYRTYKKGNNIKIKILYINASEAKVALSEKFS